MKKVKHIMTRDSTAVSEDATLKEVTEILVHHRFTGVPVVDAELRVVGFISEKDIISSAFPGQFGVSDDFFVRNFALLARQMSQVGEKYVRDYMTRDTVTVTEEEDLTNLAEAMIKGAMKSVPVVREGKLVGVVSRAALCRSLMEESE